MSAWIDVLHKWRKRLPYLKVLLAIVALFALAILWRESERQYVTMMNLTQRLEALRPLIMDEKLPLKKYSPAGEVAWKPMLIAMQFEAKQALGRMQGFHATGSMYEPLSRFAAVNLDDAPSVKHFLSKMSFGQAALETNVPLVFSADEQRYSRLSVAAFRQEITAMQSREAAYVDWLSPILYQQQRLDRSTTCKTLMELKAFQTYADRLKSRCEAKKNKWAVCGGESEPITRQMKELQMTLESNLKKFQSRWPRENVNELCANF